MMLAFDKWETKRIGLDAESTIRNFATVWRNQGSVGASNFRRGEEKCPAQPTLMTHSARYTQGDLSQPVAVGATGFERLPNQYG